MCIHPQLFIYFFGVENNLCCDLSVKLTLLNLHSQEPISRPIHEFDTNSLLDILPEIPLWVKHPDYDRVGSKLLSPFFFCLNLISYILHYVVHTFYLCSKLYNSAD